MAILNFDYQFVYFYEPFISVRLASDRVPEGIASDGLLDTGSELTLFDAATARLLQIDLATAPTRLIGGVGGRIEVRLAEVQLQLLSQTTLSTFLEVGFVAELDSSFGNVIGRDVMENFLFALNHGNRTGYLSPRPS